MRAALPLVALLLLTGCTAVDGPVSGPPIGLARPGRLGLQPADLLAQVRVLLEVAPSGGVFLFPVVVTPPAAALADFDPRLGDLAGGLCGIAQPYGAPELVIPREEHVTA